MPYFNKWKFENLFSKKYLHYWLLFGILIFSAALRLWNTPLRFSLGDEPIRDAFVGLWGAKTLQFPLTGPFSSLGPFTFGPWYWYHLIFANLLIPTAYASWFVLEFLSLGFCFIMYKIGDELQGKYLGLLLAFLAAVSPGQAVSAIILTNPSLIPFYAALSFLLFILLVKKNRSSWFSFLFGIVLGIGINIHYQMSGLLILPVLLVIQRRKISLIWTIGAGLVLTFLPMLFFDLNNHWYMLRGVWFYYFFARHAIYVPNSWTIYLKSFWPAFWADPLGLPVIAGGLLMICSIAATAILAYKRKLSTPALFLFIAFCLNFLQLRYYWGERFYGYLYYLFPYIFIFTGLLFVYLFRLRFGKYICLILLLFVAFFALRTDISHIHTDTNNQKYYTLISAVESSFPDKKFIVYNCRDFPKSDPLTIVFLLAKDKKLDDNGMKLGFASDKCIASRSMTGIGDTTLMYTGAKFVDLSRFSKKELAKNGWEPLTPQTVFDSSARWWFKEQP
ncbi:MAG TPA: hypothetical protein VLF68_05145 [Candidatus Saccharimonadales bacterium]|nr:hypothetical protein [Candidatus Saccharimonadales bacterium]